MGLPFCWHLVADSGSGVRKVDGGFWHGLDGRHGQTWTNQKARIVCRVYPVRARRPRSLRKNWATQGAAIPCCARDVLVGRLVGADADQADFAAEAVAHRRHSGRRQPLAAVNTDVDLMHSRRERDRKLPEIATAP